MVKVRSKLDMLYNENIQSELSVSPLLANVIGIDGGNMFFAWKTTVPQAPQILKLYRVAIM